jgi:hypothetical protein
MSEWEFVDQRVDDSDVLKAHELIIESIDGENQTEAFIGNPDFQFLLIAWDLDQADTDAFAKVKALFSQADRDGYSFIVITSSLPEVIDLYREKYLLDEHLEFYFGDDIVLKTMVRANPGLILMKDAVILDKWHYNDFPEYSQIRDEYLKE